MNPVTEPSAKSGQLPRESFEPVISRPIEIENLLDTELTVNFYNLDGDHASKTCYGDLIKTINALMDYSRMLEMVCEEWHLEGFHRATYEYHANKLREIAGRFQTAVGYDYAAAVEKCQKKREKSERESDVGDDALTQAFRRSQRKNEKLWQTSETSELPENALDEYEDSTGYELSADTAVPDAEGADISSSPWEEDDEL